MAAMMVTRRSGAPTVSLAYVGCVVRDAPLNRREHFSRAANMFQLNLLDGLARAGIRPSLLLSWIPTSSYPSTNILWSRGRRDQLDNGMEVRYFAFPNVFVLKQLWVGLATICRLFVWGLRHRNEHRVVVTYNLSLPPAWATWIGARLAGAKVVALVCDIRVPGHTVSRWPHHRLDYWMSTALLPRFDAIAAVSDKIISDFAPEVPAIRLSGGVSDAMLQSGGRPGAARPDRFTVVAAGGLVAENGVEEILGAFQLLTDARYRLVVAGTGPMATLVEEAAARDSRIEFRGFVDLEELLAIYQSADALINMRITKALNTDYVFPSKTFEYLASGKPVITTSTGHLEDEYGDVVIFVRDESAAGLADAIRRAAELSPEQLRAMGTAARERIAATSTWTVQGERLAALLRSTDAVAG